MKKKNKKCDGIQEDKWRKKNERLRNDRKTERRRNGTYEDIRGRQERNNKPCMKLRKRHKLTTTSQQIQKKKNKADREKYKSMQIQLIFHYLFLIRLFYRIPEINDG